VKFALEEVLGLYSTFGEEIFLGLSSILAVRLGGRNMSSTHTCSQVGPDLDTLGYEIPSLAVIAFEFVELNLKKIYASAFNSTNIKRSSNTGVLR
jgi:hypothetical protein